MVKVLTEESNLFETNREEYENKLKLFEPMIDFRRVSASVMGKIFFDVNSSPKIIYKY